MMNPWGGLPNYQKLRHRSCVSGHTLFGAKKARNLFLAQCFRRLKPCVRQVRKPWFWGEALVCSLHLPPFVTFVWEAVSMGYQPYTPHPTPGTLHPTPCTRHPAPYTFGWPDYLDDQVDSEQ